MLLPCRLSCRFFTFARFRRCQAPDVWGSNPQREGAFDCSCQSPQPGASCTLTWPCQPHTPGVWSLEVPGEAFFRNLTLLTEKEQTRCLSMSIGVTNMACPR